MFHTKRNRTESLLLFHKPLTTNAQKTAIMKRSYLDIQESSSRRNVGRDSSTQIAPIFIEPEDDNTKIDNKRPRKNALLNLLIRAIEDEQIHSKDKTGVDTKINYGSNILNDDSTVASTITSSTASNSTIIEIDSAAAKQIVDRVPSDDHPLFLMSNGECISSAEYVSPLPNGRPLMAPPRLPTHYIPGQVGFVADNSMPLEITLTCEVRYTKTTGKRYKQTSVPLP